MPGGSWASDRCGRRGAAGTGRFTLYVSKKPGGQKHLVGCGRTAQGTAADLNLVVQPGEGFLNLGAAALLPGKYHGDCGAGRLTRASDS